jgi:sterol desaturase/sphingolipid hydroxylase (fatty acid hydroxylase superfamily)
MSFFLTTFFNLILFYTVTTGLAFTLMSINNDLKVVQKRKPFYKDYIREIRNSIISLLIFTVIATILYETKVLEYTTLYYDIEEYGWLYYFAFIPFMFIVYDFYFYLSHLTMHNKRIFNLVHITHHKSKYVSPLSALSMHPIEAIINHGALAMLFFLLPIHASHVYIWVSVTIAYTTYLHMGVEIYPSWFLKTKVGKLVYTATEHAKHHSLFKGNYGFYTLTWDKLFKTTTASKLNCE